MTIETTIFTYKISNKEEGVDKYNFFDAETIKRMEGGNHIYITKKTISLLSN